MKKLLLLLITIVSLTGYANATVVAPQYTHKSKKIEFTKKLSFNNLAWKKIKKFVPAHSQTSVGQNALIGILLVILGALLFIPELVKIIAATLIILGVILFVLDIIGMI